MSTPTTAKRLAAGTAALAGIALSLAAPMAHAETSTPAGCTAEGQVWLMVVTEDGTKLADQCVGTPKTGVEALEAANVKIVRDAKNMLCTLGGHPAACPTKFNGQYWAYYQADASGKWTYATKGPDESAPKPGSIEGWCYNKPGTESCTMPAIDLKATGTTASSAASPSAATSQAPADEKKDSKGALPLIATLVALAAIGGGLWFWLRNKKA